MIVVIADTEKTDVWWKMPLLRLPISNCSRRNRSGQLLVQYVHVRPLTLKIRMPIFAAYWIYSGKIRGVVYDCRCMKTKKKPFNDEYLQWKNSYRYFEKKNKD